MSRKWYAPAALAAAAVVALSGCAETGGGGEGAAGADGESVKIMVFGSFTQPPFPLAQIKTAAEAAVQRINDEGGIGGKTPIELVSCDDEMSANGATACGRQAAQEDVAAVVGAFTLFGDSIVPLLEAADIPYIGNAAISELESTSEISFPVMTAGGPNFAGAVSLQQQGCESFVIAANESATAQAAYDSFGVPSAEAIGLPTGYVPYPANTTDFSSVAARIADQTNCVIYGGGPQDSAALITALDQTGEDFIHVALSTIAFPESSLAQFGEAADGIQVLSPFEFPSTGGEAITQAVEDMKAVDPDVVIDETAVNAYAAVLIFAQAAEALDGDITGAALLELLNTPGTTIDTGLFAPTDFAADAGFFPPIPRAVGSVYQPYVAENGVYVPNGDPLELAGTF
ncbi:ABC transporter substrate-binding protein [Microbacterium rhizophilus]|uniref:ABC transporter substrate-binding protein n=1 Tax=Microbacterium rhizophilus TaxID=3138934 RepID=UPI0031EE36AE